MDPKQVQPEELGFEAYVVVGNTLHVLRNGVAHDDQQRLGLPMEELIRLHDLLEPVEPQWMLRKLNRMPQDDRSLLAYLLRLAAHLLGERADELLGAPAEIRAVITDFLNQPVPGDRA